MLLDNKNDNPRVYEWIERKTQAGEMDIVTGYFTVGALAWFADRFASKTKSPIKAFRMILGDIANTEQQDERTLDLLSENITVEAALNLSAAARRAVEFLRQDKLQIQTLEPNFCHAKVWINKVPGQNEGKGYHIFGSSNLTEAGMGLKETHNVELNVVNMDTDLTHDKLQEWFDKLWRSPEAHKTKTLVNESGHKTQTSVKNYLIGKIEEIFRSYSPREIYYKVLFELFGPDLLVEMADPQARTRIGRLQNTTIFNSLYEFQQKGALSLIKMLQNYDGAILADAVGLGKTWTALAVMKFFQMQGREVLLLCPKKLDHNWNRFRKHRESRFESDGFEYSIRFHTDMIDNRLEADRYSRDRADTRFINDKPKLLVIDESHNFRNSDSKRYKFLVEEILQKNPDVKVLMLSATPINCDLKDIRNQFLLIKKGQGRGFHESHGIHDLEIMFRQVERIFNKWKENENPKISTFIESLPGEFTQFSDSLVVARTRAMIEGHSNSFSFPRKTRPQNIFITPEKIGNYTCFEKLLDDLPLKLSAYQPSRYTRQNEENEKKAADYSVLHDQRKREIALVKMLSVLFIKRLESSWKSFQLTLQRVRAYHQDSLEKLQEYQSSRKDSVLDATLEEHLDKMDKNEWDENEMAEEEWALGRGKTVSLAEIDKAGRLADFAGDLKEDIQCLNRLLENLQMLETEVREEITQKKNPKHDEKLASLMAEIRRKRERGRNAGNPKVLIFTAYKDTACYLYDQLSRRGLNRLAWVGGDAAQSDDMEHETAKYEAILDRFAPCARLYLGRKWEFTPSEGLSIREGCREWAEWAKTRKDEDSFRKVAACLENPIDLLIATDVLSEGQNFQDCDMVINYDIHWNPVRVVQRMGRIDRLGSPNEEIFGINYWPGRDIDEYLGLKKRVEDRMVLMAVSGSEVEAELTKDMEGIMGEKSEFEEKMKERMLKKMETSWEDIEETSGSLSFDNLSLEEFRQDLAAELQDKMDTYKRMPRAVYSGFREAQGSGGEDWGIVALLGGPARPPGVPEHKYTHYELIFVDGEGRACMNSRKEILDYLARHKDAARHVPQNVDRGDAEAISPLAEAMGKWLDSQSRQERTNKDGTKTTVAGEQTMDMLKGLKAGSTQTVQDIQQGHKAAKHYNRDGFDLIAWFRVA